MTKREEAKARALAKKEEVAARDKLSSALAFLRGSWRDREVVYEFAKLAHNYEDDEQSEQAKAVAALITEMTRHTDDYFAQNLIIAADCQKALDALMKAKP